MTCHLLRGGWGRGTWVNLVFWEDISRSSTCGDTRAGTRSRGPIHAPVCPGCRTLCQASVQYTHPYTCVAADRRRPESSSHGCSVEAIASLSAMETSLMALFGTASCSSEQFCRPVSSSLAIGEKHLSAQAWLARARGTATTRLSASSCCKTTRPASRRDDVDVKQSGSPRRCLLTGRH
jgi:hypothetical protein